jgi:hypothetical protein
MEQSLLEAALGYAAQGIPVFPLKAKEKVPLTVRGFKDATTDEQTIRAWWTRWPNANVGIPTGAASGWAVVDIDAQGGGLDSLKELVDAYGEIPTGRRSKTGNGGAHLIFQHVNGFRNSASKLAKGIDTRGDGGYIVAPPSVHPNGTVYQWTDEGEPGELPAWLDPRNTPGNLSSLNLTRRSIDSRGVERCRAYLEKVPNAISGNGGHGATLRAACECFRFGLTESQAWDMLCWFNASKCDPEWSERELRHKLKEGRKLVDAEGRFGARLAEGAEDMDWPVLRDSIPAVPEDQVEPYTPPAKSSFPAELLQPPGFAGEICQWINETAIKPQPVLTLANVLAFFGAVVGRKVRTPTDARTNLYCLGVGESGCGKDHSRKQIKRICEAAGLTGELLGGEDVSSDSAILAAVATRPSILFQLDEIGHFIANVNSKYAANHQKSIAPTLTKLFSSANTTFIGKEYAGDTPRRDIVQPNVCLYGTTVPSRLYDGLTPSEISDGFLGRMLVFQSDTPDPHECEVEIQEVPAGIVTMIQAWYGRNDLPRAEGNLAAVIQHVPITVRFEDEAQAEIARFRARCRDHKANNRGPMNLDVLWSRAVEHAMKVSLVLACGESYQTPIVSGMTAAWAVRLVEHLVSSLVNVIRDSVAGSDSERDLLLVQRIIREAGPEGINRSNLFNRTRKLSNRQREESLTQLLISERIIKTERKGARGAPSIVYVATNY